MHENSFDLENVYWGLQSCTAACVKFYEPLTMKHTAVPNFVTLSDISDLKSWLYYLTNTVLCALNCTITMENKEQIFCLCIHTL